MPNEDLAEQLDPQEKIKRQEKTIRDLRDINVKLSRQRDDGVQECLRNQRLLAEKEKTIHEFALQSVMFVYALEQLGVTPERLVNTSFESSAPGHEGEDISQLLSNTLAGQPGDLFEPWIDFVSAAAEGVEDRSKAKELLKSIGQ